jgi:hypothetical protein
MDEQEIKDIFEQFFQKYRKSEGDENTYTAFWSDISPEGKVEIAMTRCPADTTFKFYLNNKKIHEVKEWEEFFPALKKFEQRLGQGFNREGFFSGMRDMT